MEEVLILGPLYKLGKITSKYLIIDILAYSFDDFTIVCKYLYSFSASLRCLLEKNYILIRNMLWDTHNFFGASLLPTQNYLTSQAAHRHLEKILLRKCKEAKTVDYGLRILPDTVLRIACTEEYKWLLQPELKAIKDGLTYGEIEAKEDFFHYQQKYKGYLNQLGKPHGVGIKILKHGAKEIGEWQEDELHGIAMIKDSYIESLWGQYKNGKREGYITEKYEDGRVNYCQYKNGVHNGYGIFTTYDKKVYRGQFKDGKWKGYGHMKYPNNEECEGLWDSDNRYGDFIFKETSTGRIERRRYIHNFSFKVLEIIKKGD